MPVDNSVEDSIAFLSYVRNDDTHDNGQISRMREVLEGELRMQTGKQFKIFQDRNDIRWGEEWRVKIEGSLKEAVFLFPVITPSFFRSHMCQVEFNEFLLKEKELGLNRLIMPIYYVTCEEVEKSDSKSDSDVARTVRSRNYFDWREFRFTGLSDANLRKSITDMALEVKAAISSVQVELDAERDAREAKGEIQKVEIIEPEVSELKTIEPEIDLGPNYKVYTTDFDEIVKPIELSSAKELTAMRSRVKFSKELLKSDELDLLKNLKKERIKGKLSVSFLLDNSGSMRGRRIQNLTTSMLLIGEQLSRLEVNFEILGHTTGAWKGGSSRAKWLNEGRPYKPGRLNDLRLIEYKSFRDDWRDVANNMALMLKEGLLKENIDGEAILWAESRLVKEETTKHLMVVVSDGAPVDDSTLAANSEKYLDKHLREVILKIDKRGLVDLHSIGIGHDTSRYYGRKRSTDIPDYFPSISAENSIKNENSTNEKGVVGAIANVLSTYFVAS